MQLARKSVSPYIYKPELRLGDLKNAKIFGACGGQKKRGGSGKKKSAPVSSKPYPFTRSMMPVSGRSGGPFCTAGLLARSKKQIGDAPGAPTIGRRGARVGTVTNAGTVARRRLDVKKRTGRGRHR